MAKLISFEFTIQPLQNATDVLVGENWVLVAGPMAITFIDFYHLSKQTRLPLPGGGSLSRAIRSKGGSWTKGPSASSSSFAAGRHYP